MTDPVGAPSPGGDGNGSGSRRLPSAPPSPTFSRHLLSRRQSSFADNNTVNSGQDERSSLLHGASRSRPPLTYGTSPRHSHLKRSHSYTGPRNHSRTGSWSSRIAHVLSPNDRQQSTYFAADAHGMGPEPKAALPYGERVWYDQFTSTDWVHDNIADAYRVKALRSRKDFWGRVYVLFDGVQGWLLSALVGVVIATVAYIIDVSEALISDFKYGYCSKGWQMTEKMCCPHGACTDWREWGELVPGSGRTEIWSEYGVYICGVVLLASASCLVTLTTKTVVSPSYRLSTLDENLAAEPAPLIGGSPHRIRDDDDDDDDGLESDNDVDDNGSESGLMPSMAAFPGRRQGQGQGQSALLAVPGKNPLSPLSPLSPISASPTPPQSQPPSSSSSSMAPMPAPTVYYSAAGSGVAEVRVILSGFVLHGFLGFQTLVMKSIGLVLSVASGLSVGKEGPYVHIATCVGNIACRLFAKYDQNDAKRREVLSAAAAAGVTVAFGAPLGGVLFCLEEVAYFFPAKTLFRTFFCCITAALTLKFLNPYGTHKIVLFQVHYGVDWAYFELASFVAVGILGGVVGAVFIKASRLWAKSFRGIPLIKANPLLEVVLVALLTAIIGYWNVLAKMPVTELLYNLAAPCDDRDNNLDDLGICPDSVDDIPKVLLKLLGAFLIKGMLTIITFGIKVPAGIYVPSMVLGGVMGRMVGHVVQWVVLRTASWPVWNGCAAMGGGSSCIQPGVYGLIAAGATMCGVTRLSVTLAVILFEITGSLDYVLPFSLAILVAKWTADAMEPLSIYDLLTEMNSYPFLNNKHKPVFTSDLADIIEPRVRRERVIDISASPLVRATALRQKLELLHRAGELDGGLPIVRDDVLVGLIPAPDLEYALDSLADEESSLCLMADVPTIDDSDDEQTPVDPTDFTPYIDRAPVALDIKSPMDLVHECFVKLGLRYICVLRDGRYAGMAHKKTFVKYVRDLESRDHV